MRDDETVGQLLREARVASGLSREGLAHELKLPMRCIEAIEADDWESLPRGGRAPLARQIADRLQVDLELHTGAFQVVPGSIELSPPDPRQERLERIVMAGLTLASLAIVAWLVVPGPSLGRKLAPAYLTGLSRAPLPPPPAARTRTLPGPGELLPEAPIDEHGILVSLRAMDTCEARIQGDDGTVLLHTLRVSEPWRLRVKGPFLLMLDNAGVVGVEVAGIRIQHGQSVGSAWTGHFDAEGHWLKPAPASLPNAPVPPPGAEPEPE